MTTFNYTTGDPGALIGGRPANMDDLANSFDNFKTFMNGANIDAGNLAPSAKPVTLLAPYVPICEAQHILTSDAAGTYVPGINASVPATGSETMGATTAGYWINLASTDYAISGLTSLLRIVVITATNSVASGINFTYGLYPLASVGGGASSLSITAGTVVSGSTVTRSAPAASSTFTDTTSDFAFPTAGVYFIGCLTSGTGAIDSNVSATARLEVHYV